MNIFFLNMKVLTALQLYNFTALQLDAKKNLSCGSKELLVDQITRHFNREWLARLNICLIFWFDMFTGTSLPRFV